MITRSIRTRALDDQKVATSSDTQSDETKAVCAEDAIQVARQIESYEGDDLIVIIETPKGSQNKFVFEPRFGTFVLKGVLPMGAVFPFDFGFVPTTLAEDGDPLDVLVLMDSPAFPGCVVPSRLVGVIEAVQTERGKAQRNDRLLAVASKSVTYQSIQELSDLGEDLIAQVEYFFISYNSQKGRTFDPTSRHGRKRAQALVRNAIRRAKSR
jgi:inorganic pyrophosphatase